jgi:hypothetical protein
MKNPPHPPLNAEQQKGGRIDVIILAQYAGCQRNGKPPLALPTKECMWSLHKEKFSWRATAAAIINNVG